jgi:DNA-binding transcriptional ArsR family regulator
MVVKSSPFGTPSRTRSLVTLRLLEESYPRELARLLDLRLFSIQRALASLERDGLVSARPRGRTRVYRLEPRYFARDELAAYLDRLAVQETELDARIRRIRLRPRRTGKRL